MHADERIWLGNITDTISHKGTSSVLIVPTADTSENDDEATASGDEGLSGDAS
jgi:hypothetical protein